MGKTCILAHLCAQAVIAGGQLLVLDPHANLLRRGLMEKIQPLRPWFFAPPCDFTNISEAICLFELLESEYKARQATPKAMEGKSPLFLVIDEFNRLFRLFDKKQIEYMRGVIADVATGGSKCGMYCLLSGHEWPLTEIGHLRKHIPGRISVKAETGDMSLVLDLKGPRLAKFLEPALKPGEAVVSVQEADFYRMRFPETHRVDCEAVAEKLRRVFSRSQAVSGQNIPILERRTDSASGEGIRPVGGGNIKRNNLRTEMRTGVRTPISERERETIIAIGRKQKQEFGEPVRRRIQAEMRKQFPYWNGRHYHKVQLVCEEQGWPVTTKKTLRRLPAEEFEEIKKAQNYTCPDCGQREPEIKLTQDRVFPGAKGGEYITSNVVGRCKSCNSRKWMHTK